jgi:hypothetical protein
MRWIWLGVMLLAASVGIGSCLLLVLETMMNSTGDLLGWISIALLIILVVFGGTVGLSFVVSPDSYRWMFPFAIVIVLVAGYAPRLLYANHVRQAQLEAVAEARAYEANLLADLLTRRQDIEARIAAQRPYTGPEALAFFNLVTRSDLTYRSLGDHSADALAMLKRALDGKILDPNVMVRGPAMIDKEDEPLFVQVFRTRIRWIGHGEKLPDTIQWLDWEAFKLLVAGGADLTLPLGDRVAEDIAKTAVAAKNPKYVQLR